MAQLAALNAAAAADPIIADTNAVDYLTRNIVFDGKLSGVPVLTVHLTGDGGVVNQHEQAYRSVVRDAKDSQLLRSPGKRGNKRATKARRRTRRMGLERHVFLKVPSAPS
jgi:hypothetical protein